MPTYGYKCFFLTLKERVKMYVLSIILVNASFLKFTNTYHLTRVNRANNIKLKYNNRK